MNKRQVRKLTVRQHNEFIALCANFNWCCLRCGQQGQLTVDHIDPHGSNSVSDNIQPLCGPCNSYKGQRCTDYRPNPHANCLSVLAGYVAERKLKHDKRMQVMYGL